MIPRSVDPHVGKPQVCVQVEIFFSISILLRQDKYFIHTQRELSVHIVHMHLHIILKNQLCSSQINPSTHFLNLLYTRHALTYTTHSHAHSYV